MKKIRYIAFVAMIMILAAGNIDAQKYFKVLDASSMSWIGGIPQSGSGTTYYIKVLLLTSEKVTFTDIWIGKEYGVPEAASTTYTDGRALGRGDTVLVRYTIHHYPPQSPLSQIPKTAYKDPPSPLKGEGLLGFTAGKRTKYVTISKFRQLPQHSYQ